MLIWLGTLAVTLIAVAIAMLGLSLGLVLTYRPLRGSCGGAGGACLCHPRSRPGDALRPRDALHPIDALEEPT